MDLKAQAKLVRQTKQLHSTWYREQYPDVAALGMDPVEHYLTIGAAMGRNPGKGFDTRHYLSAYPEVAERKLNPLVHYALEGQEKGYTRKPVRRDSAKQVNVIRTKLLSLGFTERPLEELNALLEGSEEPLARALAARELALWYMREKSPEGYGKALDYLGKARADAPDLDFRSKLVTAELLCHFHLGALPAGRLAYERAALAGEITPDAMLAWVNYQPTPELRVALINAVLGHHGIESVALLPDTSLSPYDRLTSALPLPKIADGLRVTVLVAAYEAGDTLPTALRSLQEQTWQNLEIIVLDDCSPGPETMAVANRFAAIDPRIRVIRMEQNGGAYVARNRGLDEASGEFVTLHDADDWSHPRKIETQVRFMMEHPEVMGCTTQQARTYSDLSYVRWSGSGLFTFTNTSSFLFRRKEMREDLGYWDTVRFAADNELIRRMQKVWRHDCVVHLTTGPFSFQRDSDTSIVADEFLGINGQAFGARRQYMDAQVAFHQKDQALNYALRRDTRSFPAPRIMRKSKAENTTRHFDVILGSEFRLLGGNSNSNAQEIISQKRAGLRSAIFPLYRYDVDNFERGILPEVWDEVDNDLVDVLTYGEQATCDLLILRYPPALNEISRFVPTIRPKEIRVIVNQPPMSDYGPNGILRYRLENCANTIRHYFQKDAIWHPIGPLVRDALYEHHSDELQHIKLSQQNWHNIIDIAGWDRGPVRRSPNLPMRIGRHSRDHPHKWPDRKSDILAAYPEDKNVEVHVLGGANVPQRILGRLPNNWKVFPFGSIHPREFLSEIDVWIYFSNPHWVESFGRTVIEAMATGVPVVLPEVYRPLFQDAALYATPDTAVAVARNLYANRAAYEAHSTYAQRFVQENFSFEMHINRVAPFLSGR